MKTYRCKHAVEASLWIDTAENRGLFAAWFGKHDVADRKQDVAALESQSDETAGQGPAALEPQPEEIAG